MSKDQIQEKNLSFENHGKMNLSIDKINISISSVGIKEENNDVDPKEQEAQPRISPDMPESTASNKVNNIDEQDENI